MYANEKQDLTLIEARWLERSAVLRTRASADYLSARIDLVLYSHWPPAIEFTANRRQYYLLFSIDRFRDLSIR